MNIHYATEQAYKNGYEAGVRELAELIKNAFPSISNAIDYFVKETMEGNE